MSAKEVLFALSAILCLNYANSNIFFTDNTLPANQIEKCKNVCDKNYKIAKDVTSVKGEACARGCRLFGIAEMITENSNLDLSAADEACHSSCQDGYEKSSERSACVSGCDIMGKQEREPLSISTSFSLSFYFEDGDGLQLVQTGDIQEPEYFLSDPSLKGSALGSALGLNLFGVNSKLPEMRVKTLPVDEEKVEAKQSKCWWWQLNSVVQVTHVNPCLLATLIILAVFLLVKFAFFMDDKRITTSIMADGGSSNGGFTPEFSSKCQLIMNEKPYILHSPFVPAIHKVPPPKYDELIAVSVPIEVAAGAEGGQEKEAGVASGCDTNNVAIKSSPGNPSDIQTV